MEIQQSERKTRKFKEKAYYDLHNEPNYYLLPFRFHRINEHKEVIVNEVGDFIIVPNGVVEKIICKSISKYEDEELYADLIANFFISEECIPPLIEVLATRYRTKKSFLDDFTALHIFVITLRCEHTCHYCQVSRVTQNKEAFDMSISNIDIGIYNMMKSPNPNVTMEFQGGEPLLAFDKIMYAVTKTKQLASENGKNVTYVICTNLAVITVEILLFCKEHEILISSSLDGPKFIHNANRSRPQKNSYELTLQGIELCREILGNDKISVLMTTTNLSLDYPQEIVDEYFKVGFRNIFLRPISPYSFAVRNDAKNRYDTERFLNFYKIALNHILEYNLRGEFYREDYATIILRKILTPFPVGYVDLQSPAGLVNSVIVFNYNGKVYATDEARMLAEMKDDMFLLGELSKNTYNELYYGEKIQEIALAWSNESLTGCSDCAFQPYCGADPVFHYATQGDMFGHRPTSTFCQKNMEIIRYLFELMESDTEIEKIFRNWIIQTN